MFSDSIYEIIDQLLKETLHYSQPPFEYSLEFKKYIIGALENLYYIQMRLDHPEYAKYKESKIMFMARQQAEMRIGRIEDGLNAYSEDDNEEEEEEKGEAVETVKNLNERLRKLSVDLNEVRQNIDRLKN